MSKVQKLVLIARNMKTCEDTKGVSKYFDSRTAVQDKKKKGDQQIAAHVRRQEIRVKQIFDSGTAVRDKTKRNR